MTRSFAWAALVTLLATAAGAQTVVDVSALSNDPAHPVTVRLDAGIWRATPIDPSQGGAFTSWHPWNGVNAGCGTTAGSCTQGWMWTYYLQVPGRPTIQVKSSRPGRPIPKYVTEQEAFANDATPVWLPIPATTDVTVWIGDSTHFDNLGGISVRFEQVSRSQFVADRPSISMRTGGAQRYTIDGGTSRAGQIYFVLGSASGTSPGLPLGLWTLPLNGPDPYLGFTLSSPNTQVHVATFGVLDQNGRANARLELTGPQPGAIAGLALHHAVAFFDGGGRITGISDPVRVDFVR